ncbi:hypothetical protein DY000_02013658 [Brassica cretica]|uniref:Uncharacterized protein n=1 Tax=Brassica cretica TaxID=69181 RepID=A0ABQ7CW15_BRACR|nr:hypothetical protein DY000_02013658 [Brassica cretica]
MTGELRRCREKAFSAEDSASSWKIVKLISSHVSVLLHPEAALWRQFEGV